MRVYKNVQVFNPSEDSDRPYFKHNNNISWIQKTYYDDDTEGRRREAEPIN